MIRSIIFLVLTFFTIVMCSQTKEVDLIFKDGDTIPGFGSITKDNKIAFKLSLDEKADVYEGLLVKQVIFYGDKDFKTFEFVKTAVKSAPVLMEVMVEGKANLYELKESYEDVFLKTEDKESDLRTNYRHVYMDDVDKAWYLKRKDEPVGLRIGKSFKTTAILYFKDCREIKELFKSREYLNLTKKEIIAEYNLLCPD